MNRTLPAVLVVIAVLAALSGCLSVGKPRGPVDAFLFSAGTNPSLAQDVPGALNMRSDPLEISVVVPPGTDRQRLVATFALNAEATIAVISTGERVVQENGRTANDFSAPVLYSIEVSGEKKPWRYRVTVREAETNARLAQLGFPEGSTLTPAFSPQVFSYTVVVPFATRQLRISARGESRFLKSISFDGSAAAGASAAGDVDFASGQERSLLIETLAEDGVSRERYTLTVRRGEPDSNSLLGVLEAVEGTLAPAFSPQRTEYSLQLPFAANRVGLRARSQSGLATLGLATIAASGDVQARTALQATGALTDPQGASVEFTGTDWLPLILTVTAEDGSKREYLIEVARAEPDHNNALAALAVNGAELSPAFASGRLSYAVLVPFAARQFRISARPQSAVARAVLELAAAPAGTPAPQGELEAPEGTLVAFPSGERMNLAVTVTAQDGRMLRYLLDVRRQPPERNADLGSLTPASGSLVPAFNPRLVTYALRLPAAVEAAAFTLTTAGRAATVRVEPPATLTGMNLTVPVGPGQLVVVSILVTAEDGTQRLYRVNVTREGSPEAAPPTGQPGVQPGGQTSAPPGDRPGDAQAPVGASYSGELLVTAKNLRLGARELSALAERKETVAAMGLITVRVYRGGEVLAQLPVAVAARAQGPNLSITLEQRTGRLTAAVGGLVEVETSIPTSGGRYLCYTEALTLEEAQLEIPFLLLAGNPRIAWPAPGAPAAVAGYRSQLPPGKALGGSGELEKNNKGETAVSVEISDPKTGALMRRETVWVRPGPGRIFSFGRALQLPEGAQVAYRLVARARSGKSWQASGVTQVWTTAPAYEGGFAPVLLPVADELREAKP